MTADEFQAMLSTTERAFEFGAWLRTVGSGTLVWSSGMYRLLGIHPTVQASDKLLIAATHIDDRYLQMRTFRRSEYDTAIELSRFRIRQAEGSYFEVHCYVRTIEAPGDQPRQQVGVCFESSAFMHGPLVARHLLEAFGPVDPLVLPALAQKQVEVLGTLDPLSSLDVALIRAARGLLNWSCEDLAEASGLSYSTIRRIENQTQRHVRLDTAWQVRRTFEQRGIRFVKIGATAGVTRSEQTSLH